MKEDIERLMEEQMKQSRRQEDEQRKNVAGAAFHRRLCDESMPVVDAEKEAYEIKERAEKEERREKEKTRLECRSERQMQRGRQRKQ